MSRYISPQTRRQWISRIPEHMRERVRAFRHSPSYPRWIELRSAWIPPTPIDKPWDHIGGKTAGETVWSAVEKTNGQRFAYHEKPTREQLDWWIEVYYSKELRKP